MELFDRMNGEASAPRQRRAVLFGYLGGDNLGDDAMLAGLMSVLPPELQVTVLARDPSAVSLGDRSDVRVLRANLRNALAEIMRSDFVVRVGGTSFHDEYEDVAPFTVATRYFKICLIYLVPRLLGKKVSAIGIGVGQIKKWYTRVLSWVAMASCETIIVRDLCSLDQLRSAGHKQALLGVDLAYLLRDELVTRGDREERQAQMVGVSVIDLEPYGIVQDNERFWQAFGAKLADRHGGCDFQVFSFKDNEKESDLGSAVILSESLERRGRRALIVNKTVGVRDFMCAMSACDIMYASRYHSAIISTMVGVPVVVMPYNSKLDHFAADNKVPESSIFRFDHPESWGESVATRVDLETPEFRARYGATRSAIVAAFSKA